MRVLLVADHDGARLSDATAKALTAALAFGGDVDILVAGADCRAVADEAASLEGAARIRLVEAPHLADSLAEPLAELVLSLAEGYGAVLAPASTTGKNFMPRVAAGLDVMQLSDVTRIEAPDTFERPIYAGNAVQSVRSRDRVKVLTVRTTAFAPAATGAGPAPLESADAPADPGLSRFVSRDLQKSERPELTSAGRIVSAGRAIGSKENFQIVEKVADRLGAALGASRAAVDAGYAPNDWQVGQTGKVVAPELYVAVGISGAIQHLAGMKDSKVIVAINKDEDAPIFQIADYGLVADLFEALPELERELSKIGY